MQKFNTRDGNLWFERNKSKLSTIGQDALSKVIDTMLPNYIEKDTKFLEIGCGNGARLNRLKNMLEGTFYGVDISTQAIEDGLIKFKNLHLSVQSAQSLIFSNGKFDFVYLGFFLYLVDRQDYPDVISEADRVLKPGGYMAILDFDVPNPFENVYSPNTELRSYKCDNAKAFISSGAYSLIEKKMFSHSSLDFPKNVNDRISLQVLYKETQ